METFLREHVGHISYFFRVKTKLLVSKIKTTQSEKWLESSILPKINKLSIQRQTFSTFSSSTLLTWFRTIQLGSICESPSGSSTTVWNALKSVAKISPLSGQTSVSSSSPSPSKSFWHTSPRPSPASPLSGHIRISGC